MRLMRQSCSKKPILSPANFTDAKFDSARAYPKTSVCAASSASFNAANRSFCAWRIFCSMSANCFINSAIFSSISCAELLALSPDQFMIASGSVALAVIRRHQCCSIAKARAAPAATRAPDNIAIRSLGRSGILATNECFARIECFYCFWL